MAKQDKATREKILSGLKSEVIKAKKPAAKKVVEQNKPIENETKIDELPTETKSDNTPNVTTENNGGTQSTEHTSGLQTNGTNNAESSETSSGIATETVETPIVETIENIEKPLTLFSNFTKKTEEDLNKTHIESIAENLLTQNVTDEDLNPDEDSPEYKRIMAEAEATGGVEVAELIMCVLCMWLSGDWSQKAFETYKISKEKKKVIIVSLVKIAVTKKKKSNPTWGLTLMILSASVPMLVIAFMARIAKNRETEKEAEHQKALAKIQKTYL